MIYNSTDEYGIFNYIDTNEIVSAIKAPQDDFIVVLLKSGRELELSGSIGQSVLDYLKRRSKDVSNYQHIRPTQGNFKVSEVRSVQSLEREKECSEEGNSHA